MEWDSVCVYGLNWMREVLTGGTVCVSIKNWNIHFHYITAVSVHCTLCLCVCMRVMIIIIVNGTDKCVEFKLLSSIESKTINYSMVNCEVTSLSLIIIRKSIGYRQEHDDTSLHTSAVEWRYVISTNLLFYVFINDLSLFHVSKSLTIKIYLWSMKN